MRPITSPAILALLILTLFLTPISFAASAAQPAVNSSSQQRLQECLSLAKSGNIPQALTLAKQARTIYSSERMFNVSYINTLISIADEKGTKHDAKVLNEVISVVNQLRETKQFNGDADPEMAFHLMKALGRLGQSTLKVNEQVSSKVRLYEGKIALNLKSNAGFPKNAVEALAGPMVSMAQGYAIRDEQQKAFTSLQQAVDAGFGDFETILKDPLINRLQDKAGLEELVEDDLKARYQRSVNNWSRTVVAQFQSFPIGFNVADVEGGRITNRDYLGKVLVLDMWATWCPPCRKGIPHYIKLQKNFEDEGVAVLGVSMDNPNDPNSSLAEVRKFIAEYKFNYACGMGDQSFSAQLPGKALLPTTLFVDQNGNVRYIARGYHDYAKIEAITKILASESQPVRTGMGTFSSN
ncbi:MAG: TlpA disulfide reductase family protein [Mariniblastus sp.]